MDLIVNDPGKKSEWWCYLHSSRVKVFFFTVVQESIEALCLLLWRWLGSPGISFDDALHHIEQVRAIEPDKVRTRSGGDQIFDWARKGIQS